MRRRDFLAGLSVAAPAAAASPALASETVNDVSALNPIVVDRVVEPTSVEEVSRLVAASNGPVSIGGARHSQGGQIASEGALFLDMRRLDRILQIDAEAKTISVQAGATWRAIQEAIDPLDLSVKIMQSYSNFTVGGSLSVNCHGDYVGLGPIASSVRSITLVLADGSVVVAGREENAELFAAAIGGYGGVGVIVEATLDLADNVALEISSDRMAAADYPAWHAREIENADTAAVLHYGILYPSDFDVVNAMTARRTARAVTTPDRLSPPRKATSFDIAIYELVSDTDAGKYLREEVYDRLTLRSGEVVWRNYESAEDADSLEPASRERSTYVLQEYFVPVASYSAFVAAMARILKRRRVDILNVAVRHAYADRDTLLAWAPEDVYAFVLYFRQGTDAAARAEVGIWTAELIEASLDCGGRWYLPYRIVATREQFLAAYPRAPEFFAIKSAVDPTSKFRNRLWEIYGA